MKAPFSWLRDYIDLDLPARDLAHRLTMAGIEVGEVIEIGNWSQCVVAQVLSVRPHPQADRLSLCQVDTGAGQSEVVCGAPNVAANQKVCFAQVGANLLNTHTGKYEELKPARIRGVVSEGMICSELELGLGDDHTGIIVLPEDAQIGTPLDDYLGDTVLDLEVTPNRLDCFSVLGVAHEIAALTGQKVREPEVSYPEDGPQITEAIAISVTDPDLCHRYTASLIEGVKIGPSPRWLQERLIKVGLRPINNVVDVTNYVMLEFNQPLHSFDYDRLEDRTIIVRRARLGENLVTLDGVDRKLNPDILVIADNRVPIGIGGVIGGANTEIGDATTSVLLEAATFNGYNNRETAQSFRLRTEATLRFEKGLRPELAPLALRRATQLIHQTAGGVVAKGIIDVFPGEREQPQTVCLTATRLKKVLGMEVGMDTVERVLVSLGLKVRLREIDRLEVEVPYWRNDINIEDDLVEEVVRIVGYDSVPVTMLSTPIPNQRPDPKRQLTDAVKDLLAASGLQEVINYPLVSLEDLGKVEWPNRPGDTVKISNPMNAAEECLRPTLRTSMLATLTANQGHGDGPFRMFEVGRVFRPKPEELPDEQEVVSGVLAGRRWEPNWLGNRGNEANEEEDDGFLDFYDAKGVLEGLLERLGVGAEYQPADNPFFRPGRCATVNAQGHDLGIVGEVHPAVAERFGVRAPCVGFFELNLESVLQAVSPGGRHFTSISRYPPATRDLALVVPDDIPAAQVEGIITRHSLVERVELFDIYTGENIPAETKSLAFHVYFQSHERTLTTEEVNRSLQGLLRTLEREVQASLRS